MSTVAIQPRKIDHAYATTALIMILERTTKLLSIAARGKGWGGYLIQQEVDAIPTCAEEFLLALGIELTPYTLSLSHITAQPRRALRILGDLHNAVSSLLVDRATNQVQPELGESFDTKHEVVRVRELALEFAAVARAGH